MGKKRPLPKGTEISYLGMVAEVIADDGGDTILVASEAGEEVWQWEYCGVECEIMGEE